MTDFKLPLSGDVTQAINPWKFVFDPVGSQCGLININMGNSSNPDMEAEVLAKVASYGKQLGRISDALAALVKHFEPKNEQEKHAIAAFTRMMEEIADVKKGHVK